MPRERRFVGPCWQSSLVASLKFIRLKSIFNSIFILLRTLLSL